MARKHPMQHLLIEDDASRFFDQTPPEHLKPSYNANGLPTARVSFTVEEVGIVFQGFERKSTKATKRP